MFRFGAPEYLYLLIFVPLAILLYGYSRAQKKKALERFGDLVLINKLAPTRSPGRQKVKATLFLVAVTVLLVGLARPQFGTRVETVKQEGQDIFVALDVSLSMLAQDIRPNRLEKAKREVRELIDRLEGGRIGLIAFAGEAFVECPLTLDYGAARIFLSAMGPQLIPTPGTAVADAISKAVDSFVGGETKSKVLVVITDGEDHDGRVQETAEKAAEAGIVIHTIGIGKPLGVPIPMGSDSGRKEGFRKDRQGEVVLTKLNESTLREVAEITGGQYHRVSEQGGELDDVYTAIAGLEKSELSTREVTLFDEKFQIAVELALILLVVELLISEGRKPSPEWKGRFQ